MNGTARNKRLYTMVQCALLIGIEVVLSRFLSIRTPVVRIGFGFIPMAMAGMMFGPTYGFAVGAISDLLGATLFPSGPFFPGFTLVTGLSGMTYGMLLHPKNGETWSQKNFFFRVLIAVLIINIPLELGLNTLWLTILYDKAYLAMIPVRFVKQLVMIVVQTVTVNIVHVALVQPIQRLQVKAGK